MDERAGQIVKEIAEERLQLGDSVQALQEKVVQGSNWRVHFARHPWMSLAVAAGSGFLASRLARSAWRFLLGEQN